MLWENGTFVAQHQLLDRGLQFGDGHFTTLKVVAGEPICWPLHWQRLIEANQRLGLTGLSQKAVESCLADASRQMLDSIVKIIVTAGFGQRGYRRDSTTPCCWYLTVSPNRLTIPAALRVTKAQLKLGCQPALAGLKTLNRLEQILLSQELDQTNQDQGQDYDDLIVCDSEDFVCEGTKGNLFWYDGRQWCTPSITRAGVAGVMRDNILTTSVLGDVAVADYVWTSLEQATRAFLCNSVLGAVPISEISGRALPDPTLPDVLKGLCT